MNDKQRYYALGEACNYADPDAYASDLALSSMFEGAEITSELLEQLRRIWSIANAPFRDLLKSWELSQTACAVRFCIPLRTVQSWALGERSCPVYVRLMMDECIRR